MRIAILGTGAVGRALARAFDQLGHDVQVGTRHPETTRTRPEWTDLAVSLATYDQLTADVFVNCTSGQGTIAAVEAVGPALDGAVLIDASNPLDFSQGFPPSLSVCNTDSLAEQIQRALPAARVVKMFNTTANEVMVNPTGLAAESTLFVAGDDEQARATAAGLARELGWTDVLDLGDLTGARGLEMWVTLWVRLYQTLGKAEFNLKIVR